MAMSSMKKCFVILTIVFVFFAIGCIWMMLVAKKDLRCEPMKNKRFGYLKLNPYKTVECKDVIWKYTTWKPILLGLFIVYHVIIYFLTPWPVDVDNLLDAKIRRKICELIKQIIILGVYVGLCTYVYYDIVIFCYKEIVLQETSPFVPCNATFGNHTIKEECQLLGSSTKINKTLMLPLVVNALIILTYFGEIFSIGLGLLKEEYDHVTDVDQ